MPIASGRGCCLLPGRTDVSIAWARARFLGRDPTFLAALAPFAVLAAVLFTRWPGTNYIFDEQEALLANPYVNDSRRPALHRRHPPRLLGAAAGPQHRLVPAHPQLPLAGHLAALVEAGGPLPPALHPSRLQRLLPRHQRGADHRHRLGVDAAARAGVAGGAPLRHLRGAHRGHQRHRRNRRRARRHGGALALAALSLPGWAMPFAVFMAVAFGLFCKESALVCVPLVPFAALLVAPLTHPERPAALPPRRARAPAARRRRSTSTSSCAGAGSPPLSPRSCWRRPSTTRRCPTRLAHEFLVWFHQAPLPKDPLNNPLVDADRAHRIAGALRVYLRGLGQIVFPDPLSGDYSFPQEPIPERVVFPQSVAGAALTVLPPLASLVLWSWPAPRAASARAAARGDDAEALPGRRRRGSRRRAPRGPGAAPLLAVPGGAGRPGPRPARSPPRLARHPAVGGRPSRPACSAWACSPRACRRSRRPDPRPLGLSGLILVARRPHLGGGQLLPPLQHPRRAPHRAGRALLVLPRHRHQRWCSRSSSRGSTRAPCAAACPAGPGAPRALLALPGAVQAYRHAMDYRSDVDFWHATKDAVPRSAKAHLNYSVMKGARGDLDTRLDESRIAMELAPKWAMAHVYTGDTLCRMHNAARGVGVLPRRLRPRPQRSEPDRAGAPVPLRREGAHPHEDELRAHRRRSTRGRGSRTSATDTLANYEKNKGVDPKYRPRGYNEGPKE